LIESAVVLYMLVTYRKNISLTLASVAIFRGQKAPNNFSAGAATRTLLGELTTLYAIC